jgi:ankyrin repeat protein
LINSNVLKGGLGETAVHIAAAAGNLAMLEMLLGHRADPNAEDHLRETPLHYAAMTGKAGSIRLLLKHGAEPQVESAFAETPLCVAEQNPAAFLGIRTEKAAELLKVWAAAAQTQDSDAAYEARDQKTNVKPKEGGHLTQFKNTRLDQPQLNGRVRDILMRALIAAEVVDDPTSAKWRNKSAEELALVSVRANLTQLIAL